MDELLKKLLEADILTEETKADLEAAFQTKLTEPVQTVEAKTSERVRAELTEQWVTQRDALVEAVDTKVNEYLSRELNELKTDIESFRDLEAEYATKLVEAKGQMATDLQKDMEELVEKLNTFLEIRLTKELEELKEDIDAAKKLQFGKEIFEGFVKEYRSSFVNEDGIEAELVEARKKLQETEAKLTEATKSIEQGVRDTKLAKLLQPLSGKQRDVMESILINVPTAQLDDGYKTFISRVLKEDATIEKTEVKTTATKESKEKENKVLAESDSKGDKKEGVKTGIVIEGNVVETLKAEVDEGSKENQLDESVKADLRKLAGF